MSAHAILPPSAAGRWGGQCPGSVPLEAAYPEAEQSEEAKEGDAAHWLAATILREHVRADDAMKPGEMRPLPGVNAIAPNGVAVTEEMVDAVGVYVSDILATASADLASLHIEERVNATNIHSDNWGTPDCWLWRPQGNGGVLALWDFKFGHRFVDAFENWQCIDYAAGIMQRPEFTDLDHANVQVVINVIQPRNFHPLGPVRRWATTLADLQRKFAVLMYAAQDALGPSPQTVPGDECRDCRGRHACEALQFAADEAMDISKSSVAVELPPVALGIELRMLQRAAKMLDARITGLEAEAFAQLRKGAAVPFFQIGQGDGRENWTKTVPEILTLGMLMGVDLKKPDTPITPAQARKAGLPANLVTAYSERPKGALKLLPLDDTTAKKVFSL